MCLSSKMNVTHVTTSQVFRSISNFPSPLLFFSSRLSILYYFNLSLYSKSCPLIHLSFSSSLLAVFPFHLFLKAKWCSNKHTHIPTHTTQSSAPQDQSFHQNPLLTAADIIFGLSHLRLASLVNTYLLYLDLSFSCSLRYCLWSQMVL